MNPLLSTQEVADQLGVSICTIYREVRKGKLKQFKVGRLARYRPEDVAGYIDSNQTEPVPERKAVKTARFKYVPGMKVV